MNILGFDTGLNKTYLALFNDGNLYSKTIESTDEKFHSAYLIQSIVSILDEHKLRPQDIDLVATNIGPGSFTGIRVGLTVARSFAQGIDADTVGINSLELISAAYGLPAITVLDARKNKAYVGNDQYTKLVDLDNLCELLNKYEGKIISDTKMQEFLSDNGINSYNFENETKDYGKILLELAIDKYSDGKAVKWPNLKPLYIQPPPIHIKK